MVKLEGTIAMYNYCLPALSAWAVRFGYTLPAAQDVARLRGYYDNEYLKLKGWLGCHSYDGEHTTIKIRAGEIEELGTWAHEFAHFIQRVNLGSMYRTSYDTANLDGYKSNFLEAQAREADDMIMLFSAQGWLDWKDEYCVDGESSVWPRPRAAKSRSWGMSYEAFYHNRSYDIVPWWESDYAQYWVPAQALLNALVVIALKLNTGYPGSTHIQNMQQYAA